MFLLLVGVLVFFLRSGNNTSGENHWDMPEKTQEFDERMMDIEHKPVPNIATEPSILHTPSTNIFEGYSETAIQPSTVFENASELFGTSTPQAPPTSLMGMLDANGQEVIEYPVGSGNQWTRVDATQAWSVKE